MASGIRKCVVPYCKNVQDKRHYFPNKESQLDIFNMWVKNINNPKLNQMSREDILKKRYVVCHIHFEKGVCDDYRRSLPVDAVPTLNLPVPLGDLKVERDIIPSKIGKLMEVAGMKEKVMKLMKLQDVCCVMGCKIQNKRKRFSLFRFPKDIKRAELWHKACNLDRFGEMKVEDLYKTEYRVCDDHFHENMFLNKEKNRLQSDAVPTENLSNGSVDIKNFVEEITVEEAQLQSFEEPVGQKDPLALVVPSKTPTTAAMPEVKLVKTGQNTTILGNKILTPIKFKPNTSKIINLIPIMGQPNAKLINIIPNAALVNNITPVQVNKQKNVMNVIQAKNTVNVASTSNNIIRLVEVNKPSTSNANIMPLEANNPSSSKATNPVPIKIKTNLKRSSDILSTLESANKKLKVAGNKDMVENVLTTLKTKNVVNISGEVDNNVNFKDKPALESKNDKVHVVSKENIYNYNRINNIIYLEIIENNDDQNISNNVNDLNNTSQQVVPCAVKDCYDQSSPRFGFPIDRPDQLSRWIVLTGNYELKDLSSTSLFYTHKICGKHFEKHMIASDGTLIYEALPTLNMPVLDSHMSFYMFGVVDKDCHYMMCPNKKRPGVFYYAYPNRRVFQWRVAAGRVKNENQTNFSKCYICSDHFTPDCFYKDCRALLKKTATPRIFKENGKTITNENDETAQPDEEDETEGEEGESCSVINCPIKGSKTRFKFPKNREIWEIWVKNVLNYLFVTDYSQTLKLRVCAYHFDYKMFTNVNRKTIRKDAFPSVNLMKNSIVKIVEYDLYSIKNMVCIYKNCKSNNTKGVYFFMFPYSMERWKSWCKKSGQSSIFSQNRRKFHFNYMICHKHFVDDDFYSISRKLLSRKAVPIPYNISHTIGQTKSTFKNHPDVKIVGPIKTIEIIDSDEEAERSRPIVLEVHEENVEPVEEPYCVISSKSISFPHRGKSYKYNREFRNGDKEPITYYPYLKRYLPVQYKRADWKAKCKYHTAIVIDDDDEFERKILGTMVLQLAKQYKRNQVKNNQRLGREYTRKMQTIARLSRLSGSTIPSSGATTECMPVPSLVSISNITSEKETNYTIAKPTQLSSTTTSSLQATRHMPSLMSISTNSNANLSSNGTNNTIPKPPQLPSSTNSSGENNTNTLPSLPVIDL
ncbi:unnamed protein product [Brassicogethes aeneus]|uniref:THAP-type domain-containing protein n=1 Tax=Brassicogethes aeneus TaxID=1431903 RepID=A0A9P0FJD5_BRAAE|nr:unnamed protein product [Brassicogethes aeneus]